MQAAAAEDALSITGGTELTDIPEGTPVIIRGIVVSEITPISKLTAGIYTADGQPVYERTVTPDADTYNVSALDSFLSFNLLEIGSYEYRITASNAAATDAERAAFEAVLEAAKGICATESSSTETLATAVTVLTEAMAPFGVLPAGTMLAMLDTQLTAAEEMAASICDNWQKKNQDIYQYLVQELF